MMFSSRGEYGLKAVINLANIYPLRQKLRIIAEKENIPVKYLEQLMRPLKKNKIVKSQKGKYGGYALLSDPKKIRAGRIVEILEGPLVPMKCHLCPTEKRCPSSQVWLKLEREVRKTLNNIKLSDLIK
jgi:Rrf2 family transcriptional regulator, cysteine metabolism repressor